MLDAGSIIFLEVGFYNGPRDKYLVVLDVDTEVHVVTINSTVNRFFGRGEFGECYVLIDCEAHPFLDRDSHIDCNEVIKLSLVDVVAEIRRNANALQGKVSETVACAMVAAIRRTPVLSAIEKDRYCGCLAAE